MPLSRRELLKAALASTITAGCSIPALAKIAAKPEVSWTWEKSQWFNDAFCWRATGFLKDPSGPNYHVFVQFCDVDEPTEDDEAALTEEVLRHWRRARREA